MRIFGFLFATLTASSVLLIAAEPVAPKLRLPDSVAPTSYRVSLTLDSAKPTFTGSIHIALDVRQPTDVIWLNAVNIDVQKATVQSGGKSVSARAVTGQSNFVGLQTDTPVAAGKSELVIDYTGKVNQGSSSGIFGMEDNGNKYLFTQFESIDARAAFPCFDEPSYKVPWQVTLNIPANESAVSNTFPERESKAGDRKEIVFHQTKPLPSYLVAFAVGPFDLVDAGRAGRNHIPVRIVTPKGHAQEGRYAAEVTSTIITRLEDYFGIPFPYEKSDQVAIPVTFGFGAMENAGMVTYAQTILLAKPDRDTEARRRSYASVAAHELAHQWFGDLVTTAWWNDIWLNEAFATWMEQKLIREWKPEWKTAAEDVSEKLFAEGEDSLVTARKIRQEIKSNDDISNAFDGITYQKGAAVIGMFESYIGPEEFRKGVHSYLERYAFKNATAPEFLDAISTASGKNITSAFSSFLNQPGVPLVSVALDCKQGSPALHLKQERYLPIGSKGSTDQVWQVPLCVRYGSGDSGQSACELLSSAQGDMQLKTSACPAWVQANDKAVGYYRVNYDHALLAALTSGDVQQRLSAPERVDFMGNASALASGGKLPLQDALGLVSVFHDDPARQVVETALELALQPSGHLVPQSLRPNYQRFLQKNFKARAEQLGWTPSPGEDDDRRLLRPALVRPIATTGNDTELAKQGEALAERWFQDHSAVDPSMVASVLGTAAYYGDAKLAARFREELSRTKDRTERQRILNAMQSFRDPKALEDNRMALLNGQIPFMEGLALLFAGQGREETRMSAFEFMKAHFDEIAKKRPTGGGFDAGAVFPRVGQSFCSPDQRKELEDFFKPRVNEFTGAPRALAQVLEGIDLCIAEKQAEQPEVDSFLKNF
jgi:alanyl aminopeptidase